MDENNAGGGDRYGRLNHSLLNFLAFLFCALNVLIFASFSLFCIVFLFFKFSLLFDLI